jgi:predicted GNAT family N-acyltransferase
MIEGLIRLTDDYDFKAFDCGDEDLNDFFFNDSKSYQRSLLAVTYILQSNDEIVGFFCVSNDRICSEDTNIGSRWKKVKSLLPFAKRRSSYPAVKIGRFAINEKFQKDGYGKKLMNAIKYSFLVGNKTGCRFIIVDAYLKSVPFYTRNGFIELPTENPDRNRDTKLMYFDLGIFSP